VQVHGWQGDGPPPLTGINAGQLSDTIIFAMGFGVGGGWDGVDLAKVDVEGSNPPR